MRWQAPDEGTGTDAILVAGAIDVISEGDFSSSNNAAKMAFRVGSSGTAAEKMSLSSAGLLTIADDFMIKDGGTIGVASTNDAITISSAGIVTFKDDIIIKDAGTIGSASDTDAISISSGGVVNISATTANTSASDGALTVAGGRGVAADASIGDDLRLISDAAVLSVGADSDVTLTHGADTGILLNSTMAIQFNDASQSINAPSNAILDINATDEIELNATLLDVNANINASGTYTGAGLMTTGGNIVIPDAGNIGSASDTNAIAIGSDGDVTLTQDLELQHDGAILSFGANDEVTLTHVHDDGLLLNTDMQLQFRDSAINIRSDADGDLDINADDELELNSTLIDVNGNLDVSGTLTQAGVATFSVAANVAQVALSSSSNAVAWDASAAANAFHVTTENTTFSAPSNAVEGAFIALEINYNGSHTIAFNTVFEFAASTAPTFTSTDGKTDILVFRYNGAVWQEVGRTLNLSES